jgi:hypothetical protein
MSNMRAFTRQWLAGSVIFLSGLVWGMSSYGVAVPLIDVAVIWAFFVTLVLWLAIDGLVVLYYQRTISLIMGRQSFGIRFFFRGVEWEALKEKASRAQEIVHDLERQADEFPETRGMARDLLRREGLDETIVILAEAKRRQQDALAQHEERSRMLGFVSA